MFFPHGEAPFWQWWRKYCSPCSGEPRGYPWGNDSAEWFPHSGSPEDYWVWIILLPGKGNDSSWLHKKPGHRKAPRPGLHERPFCGKGSGKRKRHPKDLLPKGIPYQKQVFRHPWKQAALRRKNQIGPHSAARRAPEVKIRHPRLLPPPIVPGSSCQRGPVPPAAQRGRS